MERSLEIWEVSRDLRGCWSLPQYDSFSVTISFSANSEFTYAITALNTKQRIKAMTIGNKIHGTWTVRDTYPGDDNQEAPSELRSVSSRAARKLTGVFGPPTQQAEPQPYQKGENGPFLMLNFTDLPDSHLNLSFLGAKLPIANFMNKLRELAAPDVFKIIDITLPTMQVEGRQGIETWHKTA